MVPVAIALLLPVAFSILDVLIVAVFTKFVHEVSVAVSVPVRIIVPPLPAGSVPRLKFVVGNCTCPFMISNRFTLSADFPQLFP
jgi:hypothetical protein